MIRLHPAAWAVLGLALLITACGKKPAEVTPVPMDDPRPPAVDDSAAREAAARAAREAAERAAREEAQRRTATLEEMIFFDYDVATIRPDAQAILNAKAGLMRDDGGIRLTIEGYADERGSTEYNLALGFRRATAVRDFFTAFGLDGARFKTVSFGEERPLQQGSTEAAWARNRRAAFRVDQGPTVTGPAATTTGGGAR